MDKKEELRILNFIYQIIKDKTVQKRFETALPVNMKTGEKGEKRIIDTCEEYIANKMREIAEELQS